MKHFRIKFKHILLPYLLVSIGTIAGYLLLYWVITIKFALFPFKDEVFQFFIPFALPWLPILLIIKKRLRVLHYKDERKFFNTYGFMAFSLSLVLMFSVLYLEGVAHEAVKVNSVDDVSGLSRNTYFRINYVPLDTVSPVAFGTGRNSGKYNEKYHFTWYLAVPVMNTSGEIWYGEQFEMEPANKSDPVLLEKEVEKFYEECLVRFGSYRHQYATYYKRIRRSDDLDGYTMAMKNGGLTPTDKLIIIEPKNEPFDERAKFSLPMVLGFWGGSFIVITISIFFTQFNPQAYRRYKKFGPDKDRELTDVWDVINPLGPYKPYSILLDINLLFFLGSVIAGLHIFHPTTAQLFDAGGVSRYAIEQGAYWRLLTAMFVHSGAGHLFSNVIGGVLIVILLYEYVSWQKVLSVYVLSGIVGMVFSIMFHDNTVIVGASGAILGIYGLALAWSVMGLHPTSRLVYILSAVVLGLTFLMSAFGNADLVGHTAGLLTGFLAGVVLVLINNAESVEKPRI